MEMKDFRMSMERIKEEWKEKMEGMGSEEIRWKWTNHRGIKINGNYRGQVRNNQPHGLGEWKGDKFGDRVKGEWKEGQLDGKVAYHWDGGRQEYEIKNGRVHGKLINYFPNGRYL